MTSPKGFLKGMTLIGLLVIPPCTFAQVFKCVDEATGKTTFTDTACPDKGTGDYIPVRSANGDSGYPSDREIAASEREREQKMRARHAEWDRKAAGKNADEIVATREKKTARLYEDARNEKDLAKRSALLREAGEGRTNSAQASALTPMPAPEPSSITNCDAAGCWDNVGNRYNKAAGDTYFRSDGKACQGVGGSMNCN